MESLFLTQAGNKNIKRKDHRIVEFLERCKCILRLKTVRLINTNKHTPEEAVTCVKILEECGMGFFYNRIVRIK